MSSGAVRDEENAKREYAYSYVGIKDSDLSSLGRKLQPKLPDILEQLELPDDHFLDPYFTDERKLSFLSTLSSMVTSQQHLSGDENEGFWRTTPVCDVNDPSFKGPVGFRSRL